MNAPSNRIGSQIGLLILLLGLALLVACSGSSGTQEQVEADKVVNTQPPLPPPSMDEDASNPQDKQTTGQVTIVRSCQTDSDCVVKDIGNCCGYFPACVNKNSPTDPEGVKAKCAKEGISSICGFQEIESCSCVQGSCKAKTADGLIGTPITADPANLK